MRTCAGRSAVVVLATVATLIFANGVASADQYQGTAQTTIEYWNACNQHLGTQTYALPVNVYLNPPAPGETNPFNLHVEAGVTVGAAQAPHGAIGIISANPTATSSGLLLLQFWQLQFDGVNLTGQLVEDHQDKAAGAFNLMFAPKELVGCMPQLGVHDWVWALREGETTLRATVTAERIDMEITGNVIEGLRPFRTILTVNRVA